MTPGRHAGSSTEDALDLPGKRVRVEEAGKVIRVGSVETVAQSGALFWIAASGNEPRRLYGTALGQSIFLLPESDSALECDSALETGPAAETDEAAR